MTVSYEILDEDKFAFFQCSGFLASGAVEAAVSELLTDPGYSENLSFIADLTHLTGAEIDPIRVSRTLELISASFAEGCAAFPPILLAPTEVAQSYAKMIYRLWDQSTKHPLILADSVATALSALPPISKRMTKLLQGSASHSPLISPRPTQMTEVS